MIKTPAGRLGLLFAAALIGAQPVLAQELIVTRPAEKPPEKPAEKPAATPAPTAAKPATSPAAGLKPTIAPPAVTPTGAPATATANTPVAAADELPTGAPADDYEFLGWCTGILTGHMELYSKVKPELNAISKRWNSVDADAKQEAQQQAAGKELLGQFRHAMGVMEAASPQPISFKGQVAIQKGLGTWSGVDKLDKQNQAYSWMNFGLPGRCENKAAEIEKTGGKGKTVALNGTIAPNAPATTPAKPVAKPAPTAKTTGLRR